jgi:hypothetical protein
VLACVCNNPGNNGGGVVDGHNLEMAGKLNFIVQGTHIRPLFLYLLANLTLFRLKG